MPLKDGRLLNSKDFELMKRISEGDENAFKELFEETHKKVYSYLFRLFKDKNLTEDTLVDTYTEVWRNSGHFRGEARLLTWIIGIARNLAMNKFKELKFHECIDDLPNILTYSFSPETEITEKRALIKEALSKLSIKHREVLDLVFFQEMTYKEVSKILKIPVNTVKTRVFYAKEELKNILKKMGVRENEI